MLDSSGLTAPRPTQGHVETTDRCFGRRPHNGTVSLNNAAILTTADVTLPEKLQMPTLQCLFCQQLNLANVDYCNKCDEQLNLRPCYRCGAVDLRTATNCHKCGGAFSSAVPPVGDFDFRPSNFDQASIDGTTTSSHPAKSETEPLAAKPAYSRLDRESVEAITLPDDSPPATTSQRRTRVAVLGLLLLLLSGAFAAYVYRGHLARVDRPREPAQAPSDLADARGSEESAPPHRASQPNAVVAPTNTLHPPPARENQAAARPPAAAPRADAALSLPLPATGAGANSPEDPSPGKPCPPPIAALGLCNLDMPQEKR